MKRTSFSAAGSTFATFPIFKKSVSRFSKKHTTGTDSKISQRQKCFRQFTKTSESLTRAFTILSSEVHMVPDTAATSQVQRAAEHPRCGVPRKITPAVAAAMSLCGEASLAAESMACYAI